MALCRRRAPDPGIREPRGRTEPHRRLRHAAGTPYFETLPIWPEVHPVTSQARPAAAVHGGKGGISVLMRTWPTSRDGNDDGSEPTRTITPQGGADSRRIPSSRRYVHVILGQSPRYRTGTTAGSRPTGGRRTSHLLLLAGPVGVSLLLLSGRQLSGRQLSGRQGCYPGGRRSPVDARRAAAPQPLASCCYPRVGQECSGRESPRPVQEDPFPERTVEGYSGGCVEVQGYYG